MFNVLQYDASVPVVNVIKLVYILQLISWSSCFGDACTIYNIAVTQYRMYIWCNAACTHYMLHVGECCKWSISACVCVCVCVCGAASIIITAHPIIVHTMMFAAEHPLICHTECVCVCIATHTVYSTHSWLQACLWIWQWMEKILSWQASRTCIACCILYYHRASSVHDNSSRYAQIPWR